MKPYLASNRVPILGTILLVAGSVVLGIVIGALAYFISNLVYLLFVYPLVVGVVTMGAYYKLLQFAKVRHSILAGLIGLATGLLVALAFYATPYWILRNEFISRAQHDYQASQERASSAFDRILVEETGTGGFAGYMRLRAREGEQFTQYVVSNGMPIHEFNFTLQSTWAWLYWMFEVAFFSIPTAWIGYDAGRRAFSESANDWYDPLPKQLCAIPLESKDKLLRLLNGNSVQGIGDLACAEERLAHPMLEIYEQRSNNKKGDVLIAVKQTRRVSTKTVKRRTVGQWELTEPVHASLINDISRRAAG